MLFLCKSTLCLYQEHLRHSKKYSLDITKVSEWMALGPAASLYVLVYMTRVVLIEIHLRWISFLVFKSKCLDHFSVSASLGIQWITYYIGKIFIYCLLYIIEQKHSRQRKAYNKAQQYLYVTFLRFCLYLDPACYLGPRPPTKEGPLWQTVVLVIVNQN